MSSSYSAKVAMAIITHPKDQNSQVGGNNSKEIKRGNGKRFFTKAKSFEMKISSKGI
jgi:hypothetical protein